jgi:repressor LexA
LLGEDTSIATVSRLESGRMTLTFPWMERIAAALGISPLEIIAQPGSGLRMVPLIGEIAAGIGPWLLQEPLGWVPAIDTSRRSALLRAEAQGRQHGPLADERQLHRHSTPTRRARDGRIYAVRNQDGEATFKRYRADPPRLEPMSSNPEHKPIPSAPSRSPSSGASPTWAASSERRRPGIAGAARPRRLGPGSLN